jgi:transcriptional antiterminator NusG
MWYVIQTLGGEEEKTADMIRRIPSYYIEECFVPKRERMKKFHGCWNKVEEVLFQGYVFVISKQPEKLYQELRKIPRMTKILGREKDIFIPLNEEEEQLICGIGDRRHKTSISQIEIMERKKICVIDGPLKGYLGNIVKMNLHKREVVIKVKFMGRYMELKMGIEMVDTGSSLTA